MLWLRLASLLSVLLSHCGRPPEPLPEPDAGNPVDAGIFTEGGATSDAGVPLDAGVLTLTPTPAEATCVSAGWRLSGREVAGQTRRVLSLQPAGPWTKGALLVLHGGGGQADQFCTGGALVQPQVAFAREAVRRGDLRGRRHPVLLRLGRWPVLGTTECTVSLRAVAGNSLQWPGHGDVSLGPDLHGLPTPLAAHPCPGTCVPGGYPSAGGSAGGHLPGASEPLPPLPRGGLWRG